MSGISYLSYPQSNENLQVLRSRRNYYVDIGEGNLLKLNPQLTRAQVVNNVRREDLRIVKRTKESKNLVERLSFTPRVGENTLIFTQDNAESTVDIYTNVRNKNGLLIGNYQQICFNINDEEEYFRTGRLQDALQGDAEKGTNLIEGIMNFIEREERVILCVRGDYFDMMETILGSDLETEINHEVLFNEQP